MGFYTDTPKPITTEGLTKSYGSDRGLSPLSLEIGKGELVAIVGHNGAGKSTLLKMLAHWIVPDAGSATIDGVSLGNRVALARKVGFVPEIPNLFESFSVEYNLTLFARLWRISSNRVEETLEAFDLVPFRTTTVRTLSKGLRQRVLIGRSLLTDPVILLLDEPTSGLDVEMAREVYQLIKKCHGLGKTILFTSHRPEEIQSLATRIIHLEKGRVVFDGVSPAYATFKRQKATEMESGPLC